MIFGESTIESNQRKFFNRIAQMIANELVNYEKDEHYNLVYSCAINLAVNIILESELDDIKSCLFETLSDIRTAVYQYSGLNEPTVQTNVNIIPFKRGQDTIN